MAKRKRNDGMPKTVCQHNNTELMTNGVDGAPEEYCFDCCRFTGKRLESD